MAQLIACKTAEGIVLAGDSKTIDFQTDGKLIELSVNPLVQLGSRAAMLFGGTADGANMCRALQAFVREEGLEDIQDIYGAALPFLAAEYEKFMRKRCETLPLDPIHNVFFVLGGYTDRPRQDPFQLYLIWTKKKLPQLDGDEIGFSYTVPRRMGHEYSLNQLCRDNAPLEKLLEKVRANLDKLSETQEEVSPPFVFGTITRDGFRALN